MEDVILPTGYGDETGHLWVLLRWAHMPIFWRGVFRKRFKLVGSRCCLGPVKSGSFILWLTTSAVSHVSRK